MTFLSLPSYPTAKPGVHSVDGAPPDFRSPRRNIFLNLFMLAAILALLAWLREFGLETHTAPPAPRPPFDFALILQRYGDVQFFQSREEVEELLGPPSPQRVPEPRFARWEAWLDNGGRNVLPRNRIWEKWIDPEDEQRWIAILFADRKVYFKGRKMGDRVFIWEGDAMPADDLP
jgi:hypothetical protein